MLKPKAENTTQEEEGMSSLAENGDQQKEITNFTPSNLDQNWNISICKKLYFNIID